MATVTSLNRPAPSGDQSERRFTSHELFAGRRELVIDHAGRTYRLRITASGKLILTS